MAKLSTADRKALPASDFVFPDTRAYPINDEGHARDALARSSGKPEEAKVRAAVKRRYPGMDVAKWEIPLWKDDSKRIVYGVVLNPGMPDSQGDIVEPEDIETAAHRWLTRYRKHDVQHGEITTNFDGQPIAEVVESYIAPADMEIAGEQVLKGAWVLAAKVHDAVTWEGIQKGELTGWSVGGSGIREPVAAAA
jgi:hypothetical protein